MADPRSFRPDWVSAPGDTIIDILEERGVSHASFATAIGQSPDQARSLLEGRSTITIELARRLAAFLGASIEFWISRDHQYRADIHRFERTDPNWLSQLPIGDMIRFGWLDPVPHPSKEIEACLEFFDVPSVAAWHSKYGNWQNQVNFKDSPSFHSHPAATIAWLRQGELEAQKIECSDWNSEGLQNSLNEMRSLTREKEPQLFLPKLQQICAKNGVAVAVVRSPTGCHASGAAMFVSPNRALILLSFRYLTDDHFWFTFFHEVGHLVLHDETELFLEYSHDEQALEEVQANDYAKNLLIPETSYAKLMSLPLNQRELVRFAKTLDISAGIVVGQLQHCGRLEYSQFNHLKRKFQWSG